MTSSYHAQSLPSKSTLRDQFFLLVARIDSDAPSLRNNIAALLHSGVECQEIVEWGAIAGREKAVRKLISQILLDLGIRRRKHHGGKAPPPEALRLMAFALQNFNEDDAPKFLRTAARAVETRIKARSSAPKISIMPLAPEDNPVPYGTETSLASA